MKYLALGEVDHSCDNCGTHLVCREYNDLPVLINDMLNQCIFDRWINVTKVRIVRDVTVDVVGMKEVSDG